MKESSAKKKKDKKKATSLMCDNEGYTGATVPVKLAQPDVELELSGEGKKRRRSDASQLDHVIAKKQKKKKKKRDKLNPPAREDGGEPMSALEKFVSADNPAQKAEKAEVSVDSPRDLVDAALDDTAIVADTNQKKHTMGATDKRDMKEKKKEKKKDRLTKKDSVPVSVKFTTASPEGCCDVTLPVSNDCAMHPAAHSLTGSASTPTKQDCADHDEAPRDNQVPAPESRAKKQNKNKKKRLSMSDKAGVVDVVGSPADKQAGIVELEGDARKIESVDNMQGLSGGGSGAQESIADGGQSASAVKKMKKKKKRLSSSSAAEGGEAVGIPSDKKKDSSEGNQASLQDNGDGQTPCDDKPAGNVHDAAGNGSSEQVTQTGEAEPRSSVKKMKKKKKRLSFSNVVKVGETSVISTDTKGKAADGDHKPCGKVGAENMREDMADVQMLCEDKAVDNAQGINDDVRDKQVSKADEAQSGSSVKKKKKKKKKRDSLCNTTKIEVTVDNPTDVKADASDIGQNKDEVKDEDTVDKGKGCAVGDQATTLAVELNGASKRREKEDHGMSLTDDKRKGGKQEDSSAGIGKCVDDSTSKEKGPECPKEAVEAVKFPFAAASMSTAVGAKKNGGGPIHPVQGHQKRKLSGGSIVGVPFKRVKEDTVVFRHAELRDNSFFSKNDSYGARAHEDLVVTRGKGFRKEKTKKKRSSHHGGTINYQVNSFKFPDDSE